MAWVAFLLTILAAAVAAAGVSPTTGGQLVPLYQGGEDRRVNRLLSDHAFFVRRNRTVPPVLVHFSSNEHRDAIPAALRAGAAATRAVLLPADDERLLARFAEAAGTGDPAQRRRLFIGVALKHSSKRLTGQRFLRILELLRTRYLDLVLVSGRPCRRSDGNRAACVGGGVGPGFLRNWRSLARLARKRRVLHLGLRHYSLSVVRAVHRISTPECLDFPSRPRCRLRLPGSKAKGQAKKPDKQRTQPTGIKKQQKKLQKQQKRSSRSSPADADLHSAYSPQRAAYNAVNYLTVAQAAFNPSRRRRSFRRWCLRHSVVLLTDEALGGRHPERVLADHRLASAAAADQLPVRTAVLHWVLKKRAAAAVSPEAAAEFAATVDAGGLVGRWRHLDLIDSSAPGDQEASFFLMDPHPKQPVHSEL